MSNETLGPVLSLFRVDLFLAAHGKPSLLKIWHTYPTMMKLGKVLLCLKKIQKRYKTCDTPLEFY